ncbi:beta-eliminating lyase-related protein [Bosea sp. CS1GBMeth4]|uniref:threonine aldolase family protein n=1 Tax=Bosea sp. CS1GBMeth4 TaxID=1892849 RepID=UPI0016442C7C|nr:beta-eliminating lyase-related protein [Bosea sp. CS1GBMeth4]
MNFVSDNLAGASAPVMQAMAAANDGVSAAYGNDAWTKRVEGLFADLFEREVAVFLVATGTAANALALASLVDPWGAVLCHHEAHVAADECGAPEFFTGGAKIVGLPGDGCKLVPEVVADQLARMAAGSLHQVQPQMLSITQASECGLVYRPAEVAALKAAIRPRGLKLHMDGARFANALVALGCTPAEISWKAGVDVLSFGGTKNGAFAAEAVIVFDPADAAEMPWRRKRGGHTLSKGRLIGAQFEGLLTSGHWLDLARHANAMAGRLADAVAAAGRLRLAWPCEANEVFLVLPPSAQAGLAAQGVRYIVWSDAALPPGQGLQHGEVVGRFVCSFATQPEEVDRLAAVLNAA